MHKIIPTEQAQALIRGECDLSERFLGLFGQMLRVEVLAIVTTSPIQHLVHTKTLVKNITNFNKISSAAGTTKTYYLCDTAADVHELLTKFMVASIDNEAP